jgi:hypothetical protein
MTKEGHGLRIPELAISFVCPDDDRRSGVSSLRPGSILCKSSATDGSTQPWRRKQGSRLPLRTVSTYDTGEPTKARNRES